LIYRALINCILAILSTSLIGQELCVCIGIANTFQKDLLYQAAGPFVDLHRAHFGLGAFYTRILFQQAFPAKFFHHLENIFLALQTSTLGLPFKYPLRFTKRFHREIQNVNLSGFFQK
jgi:hypothetical protein